MLLKGLYHETEMGYKFIAGTTDYSSLFEQNRIIDDIFPKYTSLRRIVSCKNHSCSSGRSLLEKKVVNFNLQACEHTVYVQIHYVFLPLCNGVNIHQTPTNVLKWK